MLGPGFLPTAGFSSPGSAIAYSAYSIPDVMVSTTFHDYYVPLAVLNTIVSTGLSCYSRYLASVPWRGGGGSVEGALRSLGLHSTRTSCSWQDPLHGHEAWVFKRTLHLASRWSSCRAASVAFLNLTLLICKMGPTQPLSW